VKSYCSNEVEAKTTAESYKKILKETAGLGTEATRAGIIKTLKTRQFITNKGKNLEMTDKGLQFMGLIATGKGLIEFSQLTSPLTTAMYEQELDNVLNHKRLASDFYNELVNNLLYSKLESVRQMMSVLPVKEGECLNISTGEKCPECGADLVERNGKAGKFHACSGYPDCKYIKPRVNAHIESTPDKCPQCGTTVVGKEGKFGKFLACSSHQCKWTKVISKPKKCPKCDKNMLKKTSNDGKKLFLGCSGFPNCKHVEWF
jgi:DNA topoisomerase-1